MSQMTPSLSYLLRAVLAVFFLVSLGPPTIAAAEDDERVAPTAPIGIATGDLPEMRQRRYIRVLVSYNRTNYFVDMGRQRGFEYELLKGYETFLNKRAKRRDKMLIVFIPVPFNRLLPALVEGEGDIAAAGLTITPERQKKVAFTKPYVPKVSEIVVTNTSIKGLKTIEDLSGRTVYVLRASSYAQHLRALNRHFRKNGIKPVNIVEASKELATEDILELVNAGVLDLAVADHHIAEIWSSVLPNLVLWRNVEVNIGGNIAWAVRKNNPQLRKSLNTFIERIKKGTLTGNVLFKRYYKGTKWVKDPLAEQDRKKFDRFMHLFKKYGDKYGFDALAIAAQAYQESGWNHSLKSHRGAVGVMQVLPSTAADPHVNIRNINRLENNIHAGVKYLAFLRDYYFSDPEISPVDRVDFSFAAYNAGPGKIQSLRRRAKAKGLDPNKWFYNVSEVALAEIGWETVRYVANIHKYYLAYSLLEERKREKATELEQYRK